VQVKMTVKRKADDDAGGDAKKGSFDGVFQGTVPRSSLLKRTDLPTLLQNGS